MVRISLILLFLLMLVISGCDDMYPGPNLTYGSLWLDGQSQVKTDNSLMVGSWGKAFYVSDLYVFHLGNKLVRRSLNQGGVTQMIPDDLSITDKKNLAIDTAGQLLYFAAGNAIYKISFNSSGMARISPDDGGIYSSPVLSPGGDYLMAIRNGKMMRYEMAAGSWIEVLPEVNVISAVYIPETDEYYYYATYQDTGTNMAGLYSYAAGQGAGTLRMSVEYINNQAEHIFEVNYTGRYFAIRARNKDSWSIQNGILKIYDRVDEDIIEIGNNYSFAFSKTSETMIFSRKMHGMADLNKIDLDNRQTVLLWDGYYSPTSYSYTVDEIYLRFDDQLLHFKGYAANREYNPKSRGDKLLVPDAGEI